MNLPNKLTVFRILISIVIVTILLFPFHLLNVVFPKIFINETLVIDFRYIISGILFIIASITDFLDGYLARKFNQVTDFGKTLDAIADKILVNSLAIILSAQGFIHPIIPVILVTRDTIVNTIKMIIGNKGNAVAASNTGKIKTACLMIGISLTLFYNLPFELYNIRIDLFFLISATLLSLYSGIEYFVINKKELY